MVIVRKNSVDIAMVSHLQWFDTSERMKITTRSFQDWMTLRKVYQGNPVVACANLKTDCIYRLKNHTSSRAPSHPSSSAPRTASITVLGSNAETEVAASIESDTPSPSPLLLKDLVWEKLSNEVSCC